MALESHQYKIRKEKQETEVLLFDHTSLTLKNTEIKSIKRPIAEAIVLEYEWLKTFPKYSKFYFGIYFKLGDKEYLGGVLVFSNDYGVNSTFWEEKYGMTDDNMLLLSRGVCLWWTPENTASYFISKVLNIIKKTTNYKVITATVDPMANEVGIIYQASNWYYLSTMEQNEGSTRFGVIVNGHTRGSRWCREQIGSMKQADILKHFPDAKFIKQFRKSRYFYFIGNKYENKFFLDKIKHLIKPYPTKEDFKLIYHVGDNSFLIYKITNQINGKIYIGQTIRPINKRIEEYKKSCHNEYLNNSFKKYGFENFTFEVIDNCNDIIELNSKEIYWISYYNSDVAELGYNFQSGGYNASHSQETRDKISASKLGTQWVNRKIFPGTPEAKAAFARPITEEQKQYLSDISKGENGFWYGKERDTETGDKIRKTKLEQGKAFQVCRFNMASGEILDIWDSVEYGAKQTGTSPSTIKRHCTFQVKKYETPITWRYFKELSEQLAIGIHQENLYEKTKDFKKVYDPTVMKGANRNRKKVKVTNLSTQEEVIHDSIGDCSKVFNMSETMINFYCKGKYIPKINFKFEFYLCGL